MININNLLIKTKIVEFYWIPLLVGLYNVFDCLHKLNNYYKKKITKLQLSLNNTNKNYKELQNKYNQLYIEFQELNIKFNNLNNKEINELTIETDFEDRETIINNLEIEYLNSINLCDTKNDEPSNKLLSNDTTPNIIISPSNDITNEFIDSLSLDYNYNDKNIKNTSNTNWSTVAKRYFFG
jgi:hypothetical protein